MKSRLGTIGVLILIIGLGLLYQHNYLNEFPSHVHAWAQADRYALSLGFLENGFDLLHPPDVYLQPPIPPRLERTV